MRLTATFLAALLWAVPTLAADITNAGTRGAPVAAGVHTGDIIPAGGGGGDNEEIVCLPIPFGTTKNISASDGTAYLKDGMTVQTGSPDYLTQTSGTKAGYACFEVNITGGPKTVLVDFTLRSDDYNENSFVWDFTTIPEDPRDPYRRQHDEVMSGSPVVHTGEWLGNGSSSAPEFAPKTFSLATGVHKLYVRSNPDDFGIDISAIKVYEQSTPTGTLIAAACNGTTDDTNTINNAIAAAANGTTLVLPNGTCKVNNEVVFAGPDNLHFKGSGSSRLSWSGSKGTNISVIDIRSTSTGTTIGEGLVVDGNLAACTGIRVEGDNTTVSGTQIRELEAEASKSTCVGAYAIHVNEADNFKLTNNALIDDVRSFKTLTESDEIAAIGVFITGSIGNLPMGTILEDSEIRHAVGRYDGDCVQLSPGVGSAIASNWAPTTNAIVRRMKFKDCSERALKISQSGVVVDDINVDFTGLGDFYLGNENMPMIKRGIAVMFRAANNGSITNSVLKLNAKHVALGWEYFLGGTHTVNNVDVIPTVTSFCPGHGDCGVLGWGQNGLKGIQPTLDRSLPSGGSPGTLNVTDFRLCGSTAPVHPDRSLLVYGAAGYPNYAYRFNFTDSHFNRGAYHGYYDSVAKTYKPSPLTNYGGTITNSKIGGSAVQFSQWNGSFSTSGVCQ